MSVRFPLELFYCFCVAFKNPHSTCETPRFPFADSSFPKYFSVLPFTYVEKSLSEQASQAILA